MAERAPVKLGVLISGTGTNLQAIIDAIERRELRAEIRVVISNRAGVQGLERAQEHRIYPWAIQLYQEGRLTIEGRTVRIADFPAGDESLALINPRSPHSPRVRRPH
jgi:folate-dependent phosphoribosylglycinamide formyltransferase PurN